MTRLVWSLAALWLIVAAWSCVTSGTTPHGGQHQPLKRPDAHRADQ